MQLLAPLQLQCKHLILFQDALASPSGCCDLQQTKYFLHVQPIEIEAGAIQYVYVAGNCCKITCQSDSNTLINYAS